ncbi:MAG: prepilin-type N-terminal cleavage/methylation domain-containing protein [Verrucomicrobiota bacterium]
MNTKLNKKSGFSLVEMLVVIAVIGIIAAIAVPMIGNVTAQAANNAVSRNAQNIASVYSAALAAGYAGTTTVDLAYAAMRTGVTGTGEFASTRFQVPNLPDPDATPSTDADAIKAKLGMTNSPILEYTK